MSKLVLDTNEFKRLYLVTEKTDGYPYGTNPQYVPIGDVDDTLWRNYSGYIGAPDKVLAEMHFIARASLCAHAERRRALISPMFSGWGAARDPIRFSMPSESSADPLQNEIALSRLLIVYGVVPKDDELPEFKRISAQMLERLSATHSPCADAAMAAPETSANAKRHKHKTWLLARELEQDLLAALGLIMTLELQHHFLPRLSIMARVLWKRAADREYRWTGRRPTVGNEPPPGPGLG